MEFHLFRALREDSDALRGRGAANWTLGLLRLAYLPGAIHAKEVVPARNQRGGHLALAAHVTVPATAGHHNSQAARFQSPQHRGGDAHAAASSLGVSGRTAGQRGGRAGRVTRRAPAAAAAAT